MSLPSCNDDDSPVDPVSILQNMIAARIPGKPSAQDEAPKKALTLSTLTIREQDTLLDVPEDESAEKPEKVEVLGSIEERPKRTISKLKQSLKVKPPSAKSSTKSSVKVKSTRGSSVKAPKSKSKPRKSSVSEEPELPSQASVKLPSPWSAESREPGQVAKTSASTKPEPVKPKTLQRKRMSRKKNGVPKAWESTPTQPEAEGKKRGTDKRGGEQKKTSEVKSLLKLQNLFSNDNHGDKEKKTPKVNLDNFKALLKLQHPFNN